MFFCHNADFKLGASLHLSPQAALQPPPSPNYVSYLEVLLSVLSHIWVLEDIWIEKKNLF
jgi:hypothetical protein